MSGLSAPDTNVEPGTGPVDDDGVLVAEDLRKYYEKRSGLMGSLLDPDGGTSVRASTASRYRSERTKR
ncbi:hypothetical protein [Halogeometricum sp. CBA1124]|uniref:hypothetical protein n=1 Tax=Halogeometricum sp. CBA1124 TaxID=2668071 RepID=UPI00142A60D6|nr:hypothetical protein [Halogeometricum sp. CBA1124]MUV57293.1 hypothetical protein [Halogeometricum sp. CBA1124]